MTTKMGIIDNKKNNITIQVGFFFFFFVSARRISFNSLIFWQLSKKWEEQNMQWPRHVN